MSAPPWFRCKVCGISHQVLVAEPPCSKPRPPEGWTNAYSLVCKDDELYCLRHWLEMPDRTTGYERHLIEGDRRPGIGAPRLGQLGFGL